MIRATGLAVVNSSNLAAVGPPRARARSSYADERPCGPASRVYEMQGSPYVTLREAPTVAARVRRAIRRPGAASPPST